MALLTNQTFKSDVIFHQRCQKRTLLCTNKHHYGNNVMRAFQPSAPTHQNSQFTRGQRAERERNRCQWKVAVAAENQELARKGREKAEGLFLWIGSFAFGEEEAEEGPVAPLSVVEESSRRDRGGGGDVPAWSDPPPPRRPLAQRWGTALRPRRRPGRAEPGVDGRPQAETALDSRLARALRRRRRPARGAREWAVLFLFPVSPWHRHWKAMSSYF